MSVMLIIDRCMKNVASCKTLNVVNGHHFPVELSFVSYNFVKERRRALVDWDFESSDFCDSES